MAYAAKRLSALVLVLAAVGCGGEIDGATRMSESVPALEQVTPEQWQSLAERRIFFGHQSVGGNLMAGVEAILAENPQIPLRVVETANPSLMSEPGLYHARIGENGAPLTKLDAFTEVVSDEELSGSGTAMLKYCYVDVGPETDPVALFESYRSRVDSLRVENPDLTVVHVTLPLTVDRGTWAHLKATIRGGRNDRALNLKRHRYNELMRQAYGDSEPLFDLARLESTEPDGSRATVRYKGEAVPVLARRWTNDGAHLNDAGQRRMAEAFLASLASL